MGHELGFDEEAVHWVGVAIGESVMNAIKHGNRNDVAKHVFVEFDTVLLNGTAELRGCVRNQGQGFDPEAVADTLALENMHKSSGRGIFLIRNFVDDVGVQSAPAGGMEISRMTKRVQFADAPENPVES